MPIVTANQIRKPITDDSVNRIPVRVAGFAEGQELAFPVWALSGELLLAEGCIVSTYSSPTVRILADASVKPFPLTARELIDLRKSDLKMDQALPTPGRFETDLSHEVIKMDER